MGKGINHPDTYSFPFLFMIDRKLLAGVITGASLLSLLTPFVVNGKAEPKQGDIEFTSSMTVTEALDFAKKSKISPSLIQHEFSIGGETVYGGIGIDPSENSAATEKRMKEGFKNFVEMRASLSVDTSLPKEVQESQKRQIEGFKALKKSLPEIRINKIEGSSDDFSNVKSDSKVKKVDVNEEQSLGSKVTSFLFPPASKAIAAPETECWMPENDSVYMNQYSSGNRYVDQELSWDRVCWGLWATFEPDFFTYNYDANGNYYDIRESGYMPVNQYWSSNLPLAYLDTRFEDSTKYNPKGQRNEVAYTIGSAYANNIKANTNYYTYIETVKGTKASDKGKITGQYGTRNPTDCFSTWCSFGETSVWYSSTPSWSLIMPGSKTSHY